MHLSSRWVVLVLVATTLSMSSCGFGFNSENCANPPNHGFDEFHSYDDAQSLVGLSENDIVGRFGLPTTEKWEPEWDAAYWMRPQGFCMDGWYLVLNYDDSREVVAAGVVAD